MAIGEIARAATERRVAILSAIEARLLHTYLERLRCDTEVKS
jgi:hypothetical protein